MATDENILETPKQITKPKILDTGEVLQNHFVCRQTSPVSFFVEVRK